VFGGLRVKGEFEKCGLEREYKSRVESDGSRYSEENFFIDYFCLIKYV